MAAVGRFRRYIPDTTSQGFLLGTGGCSSRVERCCTKFARFKYNFKFADYPDKLPGIISKERQRLLPSKRVPKDDSEDLAGLFDNEVAALKAANAFGIRRVSTFLEEAFCENGDRCLVLK